MELVRIVSYRRPSLKINVSALLWTKQPARAAVAAAVRHQLIAFSDCDLIIANVEDHKCFVVVVTAVDSAVVVLIILRV